MRRNRLRVLGLSGLWVPAFRVLGLGAVGPPSKHAGVGGFGGH